MIKEIYVCSLALASVGLVTLYICAALFGLSKGGYLTLAGLGLYVTAPYVYAAARWAQTGVWVDPKYKLLE